MPENYFQKNAHTENPILTKAAASAGNGGTEAYTVQYKNRFLYSKYNPEKNIISAIEKTEILPGTLVIIFSPCLFYGIETLAKKCGAELGKSVFIIAVEAEEKLRQFSLEQNSRLENLPKGALQFFPNDALDTQGINLFLQELSSSYRKKIAGLSLPPPGIFRRAIRFDFSGGVFFHADFYAQFFALSQNAIAQFWKNRLTLVKLGRLFCKNIFKNLPLAASGIPFERLEKKIEMPILVLGAGESLEKTILELKELGEKIEGIFIIAVDAALAPLLSAGIKIDAVVANEAQIAIEKAYIGTKGAAAFLRKKPILFCDLVSRHTIPRITGFPPCFFFSEFEKNNFCAKLEECGILPRKIPPLGSVGLSAAYIATLLRKDDGVPIFVSGLDFSFSCGKTHANGTMAHKSRLLQHCHTMPCENYAATFSHGAEKIFGKNGKRVFTTKNLSGYATLFQSFFSSAKNIFDCGEEGLDLGIARANLIPSGKNVVYGEHQNLGDETNERNNYASDFLVGDKRALLALADILSNGENAQSRENAIP
ncbi:MAG: DUF115 domain-containing protein, partial [Treponemataceae bacterium]|nr:DUF115 domain-containing protein [Treponemataceae bacterium]